MRIRLALTLEVTRERRASSIDEHEHRDTEALVERAEPHPIGFVPTHELPDERAR